MAAIERAADVQVSKRNAGGIEQATIVVKSVPVEQVFCSAHRTVGDVALTFNRLEPKLGDRVINLTCPGVPFGFRGTVVTIHSSTKFVEVAKIIFLSFFVLVLISFLISTRCS